MPRRVVDGCAILLAQHGRILHGSTVVLVGVSYKPNIDDTRGSPAEPIARLLRNQGAALRYHDPHVSQWTLDGQSVPSLTDPTLTTNDAIDLAILLQQHSLDHHRPPLPGRLVKTAIALAAMVDDAG
jgi:UDP-N-acetyl-D-mannosaminuronate dehydrogenase